MKKFWIPITLVVTSMSTRAQAVEFPGPLAGVAMATQKGGVYTLSNHLLSVSWQAQNGQLRLSQVRNELSHKAATNDGNELFRLTDGPAPDDKVHDGFYLGWKLDEKNLTALYGDGKSWRPLKAFTRDKFPGAPTLLRAGKMNLKAEPVDYGNAGEMGATRLEDFTPKDLGAPTITKSSRAGTTVDWNAGTLKINAEANCGAASQWALKPDVTLVAARVWKDTDGGMSWGPGLALVWPNGQFALLNARKPLGEFSIATQDGESVLTSLPPAPIAYSLPASAFRLVGAPELKKLADGQELITHFRHSTKPLDVEWKAILRDGSHYLRQSVTVSSTGAAGMLTGVQVVDFPNSEVQQIGTVPGSPMAGAGWFYGVELPSGQNDTTFGARAGVACQLPLVAGATYSFASVAGVYPDGQLRRSFLAYIERERARPSRPFLHYNCWYDLAQNVNESDLNAAIAAFHEEMTVKRGVKVASYVVDDGWDDSQATFWGMNAQKFPNGFALSRRS